MGDGVYCAASVAGLATEGAEVIWCDHNARERGVAEMAGVKEAAAYATPFSAARTLLRVMGMSSTQAPTAL